MADIIHLILLVALIISAPIGIGVDIIANSKNPHNRTFQTMFLVMLAILVLNLFYLLARWSFNF